MNAQHLDLEVTYATLAQAIDEVGMEKTQRFLAKLALMLAVEIADQDVLLRNIEICKLDL